MNQRGSREMKTIGIMDQESINSKALIQMSKIINMAKSCKT